MGKSKFRLSDMIPYAWFYKLKDMSRSRKRSASQPTKKKQSSPAAITEKLHFARHTYSMDSTQSINPDRFISEKPPYSRFPDAPRTSLTRGTKRKTIYKPSPGLTSPVSAYFSSVDSSPDHDLQLSPTPGAEQSGILEAQDLFDEKDSWSNCCNCRLSSSTNDIILDVKSSKSLGRKTEKRDGCDFAPELELELELPPIRTKPAKFYDKLIDNSEFGRKSSSKRVEQTPDRARSAKILKEKKRNRSVLKSPAGVKLRANSPKIASRKIRRHAQKSTPSCYFSSKSKNKGLRESLAVVMSSVDPGRDFRESMMEMIVENKIMGSRDLEDLLACYLSLNSEEYHDLIIKSFQEILFEFSQLRI